MEIKNQTNGEMMMKRSLGYILNRRIEEPPQLKPAIFQSSVDEVGKKKIKIALIVNSNNRS